jgi:hypothetical protein
MGKKLTRRFKKLDARIKAWNDTQARIASNQIPVPASAYRKPGSMKGRS